MDRPSEIEDILSRVAAGRFGGQSSQSSPRGYHARTRTLPFDGSQIYCDPDHREEDFAELGKSKRPSRTAPVAHGHDLEPGPLEESFPDDVYEQTSSRLSLSPPVQTRFAASPSFNPRHISPFSGDAAPRPDSGGRHQQQSRRPLQPIQLETPIRHRETESSSPYFAHSSPTPLGPPGLQRQRQYDPRLGHTGTMASPGSRLDNAENIPPSMSTAGTPSLSRGNYLMQPPQVPVQRRAVAGIQRIAVSEVPLEFRGIFPYGEFNEIQSKCLPSIMNTNDNFVVSAPTGSGKTVVIELAIVHLIQTSRPTRVKAVYMAPTKALCSERHKDWSAKFGPLDVSCIEFTGDTPLGNANGPLEDAQIIVTTPEKWDSMTRKWTEYQQCLNTVRLLLIDEVHMLRDTRGPTLEFIVSRMKTLGTDVRLIALSATVPNVHDVAMWLGRRQGANDQAALLETFGEEFRPVRLQRFVYGVGQASGGGSDFNFDAAASKRLPDFISKHSMGLPILVFCTTRAVCCSTAKMLSERRASDEQAQYWWTIARQPVNSSNNELQACLNYGVAYHHAGMRQSERELVEAGFRDGRISVICCTSTLATGVNTPCHLAIIKGTKAWSDEGWAEYSEFDVLQMIGRAGRPQYNHQGAVAVIITTPANVAKYKELSFGRESLESRLHANILEYLNAGVSLGMVTNLTAAQVSLKNTFLYVRLSRNESHYQILGERRTLSLSREVRVMNACRSAIETLSKHNLVVATDDDMLESTAFGHAMVRHCLNFKTMLQLFKISHKANMSDILSQVVQADELANIKLQRADGNWYKALNAKQGIRYPLKEVTTGSHKCSLVLQAELGSVELPGMGSPSNRSRYLQAKTDVFKDIRRLVRCAIDCKVALLDAESVRNCLSLERSLCAKAWDDWPEQLKQIEGIGTARVRYLMGADVKSISDLAKADPARLNMLPTLGIKGEVLTIRAKAFPVPTVTITGTLHSTTPNLSPPIINLKVQIGFMNSVPPTTVAGQPVTLVLLVERSDGLLIDFRRLKPARSIEPILLCTELSAPGQKIICWASSEAHAGTSQHAELCPIVPTTHFSMSQKREATTSMNSSRKLSRRPSEQQRVSAAENQDDMFGLSDLDDADLLAAEEESSFRYIEEIERASRLAKATKPMTNRPGSREARRRTNGKYECNHQCADKTACKHVCCHEGLEKPPRPRKLTPVNSEGSKTGKLQQSTLKLFNATKKKDEEVQDDNCGSDDSLDPFRGKNTTRAFHPPASLSDHASPSLTTTMLPENRMQQAAEVPDFVLANNVPCTGTTTKVSFDVGENPPQTDLLSTMTEAHVGNGLNANDMDDEYIDTDFGGIDPARSPGLGLDKSHTDLPWTDDGRAMDSVSGKPIKSPESDPSLANRLPIQAIFKSSTTPVSHSKAAQSYHFDGDGSSRSGKTSLPACNDPCLMASDRTLSSIGLKNGTPAPRTQPFKDMTGIDTDVLDDFAGMVDFEDDN